jgi:hypothetical protein
MAESSQKQHERCQVIVDRLLQSGASTCNHSHSSQHTSCWEEGQIKTSCDNSSSHLVVSVLFAVLRLHTATSAKDPTAGGRN